MYPLSIVSSFLHIVVQDVEVMSQKLHMFPKHIMCMHLHVIWRWRNVLNVMVMPSDFDDVPRSLIITHH